MNILTQFQVLVEGHHGETSVYLARTADKEQMMLYLVAQPASSPLLPPHPGLMASQTLAIQDGTHWSCSELSPAPTLAELWAAGSLDERDVMHCVMQVSDALGHLIKVRPDLLPSSVEPEQVHRSSDGTWHIDLTGLALASDVRLGEGNDPVKAIGAMLGGLAGGEGPADDAGISDYTPFPSSLRLIMMRARFGGFATLVELQDALRRLAPRSEASLSTPPVKVAVPLQSPPCSPYNSKPVSPSTPKRRWRTVPGGGIVAGLAIVCLLAVSVLGFRSAGVQTTAAHVPSGSNASLNLGPVSPPLRPEPAAISKPPSVVVPEPTWADFLAAEPVYQPSPPPPVVVVAKADPTPAPPPPAQPAPAPEPLDPVALLDKAAAGNNPVAVRLFGRSLGTAYMFTNPGAPVISLDAFTQLLGRPQSAEVIGPQQLQLTFAGKTLVSSDFMLLDKRVWLVLKPELLDFLGLRVKSYGGGLLDLEPKF